MASIRRTWRESLEARISRCEGCDGLQWDGKCPQCNPNDKESDTA